MMLDMLSTKTVKICSEFIQVSNRNYFLVDIHAVLLDGELLWFEDSHRQEIFNLVNQKLKEKVVQLSRFGDTHGSNKASSRLQPTSPEVINGINVKIAFTFKRIYSNITTILCKKDSNYQSCCMFPEKMIVFSYRPDSHSSRLKPLIDTNGVSHYFKSSEEEDVKDGRKDRGVQDECSKNTKDKLKFGLKNIVMREMENDNKSTLHQKNLKFSKQTPNQRRSSTSRRKSLRSGSALRNKLNCRSSFKRFKFQRKKPLRINLNSSPCKTLQDYSALNLTGTSCLDLEGSGSEVKSSYHCNDANVSKDHQENNCVTELAHGDKYSTPDCHIVKKVLSDQTNSFRDDNPAVAVPPHSRRSDSSTSLTTSKEVMCLDVNTDCVIVEDDDSEDIEHDISLVRNVKNIALFQLHSYVLSKESHLRNIFQGKIQCRRHADYRDDKTARKVLGWQFPVHIFTDEQVDQILTSLMDIFCKRHQKYVDYLMKVLMPEVMTMLFMLVHRMDYDDAEEEMMKISLQETKDY